MSASNSAAAQAAAVEEQGRKACVSIHIRQGDRRIPGVNMKQWCKNHTKLDKNGRLDFSGMWWNEKDPFTFSHWADMGCGCPYPYGALSLEHYVNASKILFPAIDDILLFTDDDDWLFEQRALYQKQGTYRSVVRIHSFDVFKDATTGAASRNGFEAAANLWASILAAQECQGFVGHFGSAATGSFFESMCFHHQQNYLTCPDAFTF